MCIHLNLMIFTKIIRGFISTWRKLDESLRNSIDNADAAAALMLEMPAIIKRPLLCAPGRPMLLGFSEASYQQFNEV
ncbi:ArsC/Spx/MgsR family protein [Klebsiella pneumoniae]|uniref:ArsC/Spx/MgsR family protein n=1 Tax=Klebsiella pneumoniae TaxID=573 RepID=UPI0035C84947